MEKPQKFQIIGILQIISGVLQIPIAIVLFYAAFMIIGCVCGLLTFWAGGCGMLAGFAGFFCLLLIPIGILEIVSGIMCLVGDPPPIMLVKITAIAEMVGLLVGGLIGAIVGVLVMMWLSDDEIKDYIAAGPVSP